MTSTYLLAFLFVGLLAAAVLAESELSEKTDAAMEHLDEGLAVMEQCGNDDMKKTAAKLRKIEKEVIEAIAQAKDAMQKFINVPSVLIKDTVMKGMKGLVESSGTVFKGAQKAIEALKKNIPKM